MTVVDGHQVPNPNVAVAATQMEILTMATKKKTTKTAKKTSVKKRTRRQAAGKHGLAVADPKTQRRPATKSTARKPKARARPPAKSKRLRVEGAIGALDEVMAGLGAEQAEAIRQRVRSILN